MRPEPFKYDREHVVMLTDWTDESPERIFGKSDPERGVGAGLSTTDLGIRLRYEFRREFAPYIGVTWKNSWGKTADFAKAAGEDTGGARFVSGVRL